MGVARLVAPSPHPGADLREVVEGALAREGALFTAGECVVLQRFLALPEAALELWARLSLRKEHEGEAVFRVSTLRYDLDLGEAIATLAESDLIHRSAPPDRCVAAFDVPALKAGCVRLGLPSSGSRATLIERLRGRSWVDEPVLLLAHRRLIRRVELLYFQSPYLDRSSLVVERLGLMVWPAYVPTGGPGLFLDRAAMRVYERARAAEWTDPDEPLRLATQSYSGRLTPRRKAIEAILSLSPPASVLSTLATVAPNVKPELALQLEREGRASEALTVCRAGDPDPVLTLALDRTGRRLARAAGLGWAPNLPLRAAPARTLRMRTGPKGVRPTWMVGEEPLAVEAAVIRALAALGRRAIHAENWLWTCLYALVFRDLYFLPIPGMLPTARRDGPVDVGTPGFYTRRAEAVEARLARLRAEGPAPFVVGWQGERLAGLWMFRSVTEILDICAVVSGEVAAAVLERLAREGWAVARGLPDLYIFSGEHVRLESAVPARLEQRDLLVEIKGPTDALRDEQRVWHDRLLRNAIPVELWLVAAMIREIA